MKHILIRLKDALSGKRIFGYFVTGRVSILSRPVAPVALGVAGMASWFQLSCPECDAALQARLPAGVTPVKCSLSECKHIFRVRVDDSMLRDGEAPAAFRRQRGVGEVKEKKATPIQELYRACMSANVKRIKKELGCTQQAAFAHAAAGWADAPCNPKNSADAGAGTGEEDVARHGAAGDLLDFATGGAR